MEDLLDYIHINNWYRLGLQLGVSDTELNIIEENNKDIKVALRRTLQLVLRTCPDLTWKNVADALRKIGENKTARVIEDKFCRNP